MLSNGKFEPMRLVTATQVWVTSQFLASAVSNHPCNESLHPSCLHPLPATQLSRCCPRARRKNVMGSRRQQTPNTFRFNYRHHRPGAYHLDPLLLLSPASSSSRLASRGLRRVYLPSLRIPLPMCFAVDDKMQLTKY
jgi:hypothetical protein